MLVYLNIGKRDFEQDPIPDQDTVRHAWEFFACLQGNIIAEMFNPKRCDDIREPTIWAFPPDHRHSWHSRGEVDRVVFHFSEVPLEVITLLPKCGYYRASLEDTDCTRLRQLVQSAIGFRNKATVKSALFDRALALELSHMSLRLVPDQNLSGSALTQSIINKAMAWFADHMHENPRLNDVCEATSISTTHLRRLFHQAKGEGPHAAFNRLRMRRVEELLMDRDLTIEAISESVGISSASALNRAVRSHFGLTPKALREDRLQRRQFRDFGFTHR